VRKERIMSQVVQLNIPDEIARRAHEVGAMTQRDWEEVLLDWLKHAANDVPVESLSDSEVLGLSELQMAEDQSQELSDLLALNSEGELDATGHLRLDELMTVYRDGMVRRSQALREAVARGLRPPIGRE
jgi:hypothetical protein